MNLQVHTRDESTLACLSNVSIVGRLTDIFLFRFFAISAVAFGEDDELEDLLGLDYSQIRAPKGPNGEL